MIAAQHDGHILGLGTRYRFATGATPEDVVVERDKADIGVNIARDKAHTVGGVSRDPYETAQALFFDFAKHLHDRSAGKVIARIEGFSSLRWRRRVRPPDVLVGLMHLNGVDAVATQQPEALVQLGPQRIIGAGPGGDPHAPDLGRQHVLLRPPLQRLTHYRLAHPAAVVG